MINKIMMLDSFQTYLMIVNTIAFLLLSIDFWRYRKRGRNMPRIMFLTILIMGGAIGFSLSYLLFDRKKEYIVYNRKGKRIRDRKLNWKIPTFLLAIIQVILYLYHYGFIHVGMFDFSNLRVVEFLNMIVMRLGFLGIYIILINILAFYMFGRDKNNAIERRQRIENKRLFLVAVLGGAVGAILGMLFYRHKTTKWYFKLGLPMILIIQTLLLMTIK